MFQKPFCFTDGETGGRPGRIPSNLRTCPSDQLAYVKQLTHPGNSGRMADGHSKLPRLAVRG
ncbi:hypothetical protein BN381_420019 [Candidatus Microthrix parvicella RN1]|uniref:Uncharacterized protein n=1 Tax=Candidatus Neomicrothrix parvicella RN1 TaxID=1229780 RepID=R4Z1N4_9ACTN|nr:hypothetical protein BN381_420019 [Candidatus Microthrix parvicella RN1]